MAPGEGARRRKLTHPESKPAEYHFCPRCQVSKGKDHRPCFTVDCWCKCSYVEGYFA